MKQILKKILISSFSFFGMVSNAKSQLGGDSAFLHFVTTEKMTIYLDSSGKFEMTECWVNSDEQITLDIFGNRLKIKETNKSISKIYVLGVKAKKYGSSGRLKIIPFHECTDYREIRCTIRLMLQPVQNLDKAPSYIFIDYKDATYVYKIHLK